MEMNANEDDGEVSAVECKDINYVLDYVSKHTRSPADGISLLAFCLYVVHKAHLKDAPLEAMVADVVSLFRQIDLIMPLDNSTH